MQNNYCSPLFVIGSPRSGTSLLRLILTSHPNIVVPPECGFIVWLHDKYSGWIVDDAKSEAKRTEFMSDLQGSKKFDTWLLDLSIIDQAISAQMPNNYAELCALIYQEYAKHQGKKIQIWGDKNNFHINHLALLICLFPDAHFLHIVRDGRDVACSYREVMQSASSSPYAPKLDTEISKIAAEWSSNVMKVDAFLNSISPDKVKTIRYEDLVGVTESVVRDICNWLNMSYDSSMLMFYELNKTKQLEPQSTMDWKKRTMEPVSDHTVGRYLNLISSKEQFIFLEIANGALKKFGYS